MTIDIIAAAQAEIARLRADRDERIRLSRMFAEKAAAAGLDIIGWEDLITRHRMLEAKAASTEPSVTTTESAGEAEAAGFDPLGSAANQHEPEHSAVSSGDFQREPASAPPVSDTSRDADAQRETERPHPVAKASTGNGATERPMTGAADSVSGEASRPSDGGGTVATHSPEGASEAAGAASATGKTGEAEASPAPVLTLKDRIIATHREHPDWTMKMVAEHLDKPRSSIGSYSSILGLKWATTVESHPQAAVDADVEEQEQIELPRARTKQPEFNLRDSFGEYLHSNCRTMTRMEAYYWSGTEADILALKRGNPKLRDLVERPAK